VRLPLLTLLVLGIAAGAALAEAPAAPALEVTESLHDFGTVERGVTIEHRFRIRNAGTAPLHLEYVKGSCACTAAAPPERVVPPGAETAITVQLDTAKLTGRATRTVTLYSDDARQPAAGFTLTGEVVGDLVVVPTALYFGTVGRGENVEREIRVGPGRPAADYRITWIESSNRALRTRLEPLADVHGQRIVVALDGAVPVGRFHDQLLLHTTSLREPVVKVPVFGSVDGEVIVLPPQVTFGVTAGRPLPTREIHVRSRAQPITVTGVTVPSKVVGYELATVKPGREYRITLRLSAPPAEDRLEGAVEIFTDHPDERRLVVPLLAVVREPTDAL
jgi:hypothetical protein